MAVLSFTIPGMPLIYSGQEAGLNKRLKFFEKDTINWSDLSMQQFYEELIKLKKSDEALWNGMAGGPIQILTTSDPARILAFSRAKDGNQVVAVFNMSAEPVDATIELPEAVNCKEYFSGEKVKLEKGTPIKLDKWGYKIFVGE
jgi:glycosidase